MSKDAKAIVAGCAFIAVISALSAGLPWAVRKAEHRPAPYTQPLQYIGNDPPQGS